MSRIATLFTGGDGFGTGAQAAGLEPSWGVELNPAIADWAERNSPGLSVIRASVTDVDYTTLERPYWLHASPVCKNASVAKQGGEAEGDLEMALGVTRAIDALQPPVFSLENVYPYREFESFKNILACLHGHGYAFDYWHLNSADYGVPQTRKRLILLARKDSKPRCPTATHTEGGDGATMFGPGLLPWVGWYEAIEDLIPGLPESRFADWQLARLPRELKTFISDSLNYSSSNPNRFENAPARTVTVFSSKHPAPRAFILGNGQRSAVSRADEPTDTITGNSNQTGVRAVIVGTNANDTSGAKIYQTEGELVHTIRTPTGGRVLRAFIINGENASNEWGKMFREINEPNYAVSANSTTPRAAVTGRVVSMTTRCLARFQSVPDSYELPDKKGLACEIVGNMVPPLLAQRIVESVTQ